jgi:hypothetical protein
VEPGGFVEYSRAIDSRRPRSANYICERLTELENAARSSTPPLDCQISAAGDVWELSNDPFVSALR